MFHTFQFLRPDFLWLLPVLLILPFILKQTVSLKNAWEKVCDKVLLNYLTEDKKTKSLQKFNFWIYLSFLSGIIALAGPSFRQTTQHLLIEETPLMFVLDLSTDMNRTEGGLSRLARAKIEITDILTKSKAAPSGLIVYTYEPFLVSPLAYDSNIIINLLPAISTDIMPLGGNKLDRALEFAVSKLKSNHYKDGNILVLTADIPLDFDKSLAVAHKAAEQGYKTSVYGLSSKTNGKLAELAKSGNGIYLNTKYASSEALINLFKNKNADDYRENKNTINIPQDNGIMFVLISLLCLLPVFHARFWVLVMLFLIPVKANAGFLFNNNQEGALFFSSKEFGKAAEKFKNEDWKAAAYYKAGNYDAAIKILEHKNDITSLYNKGNALAKSGKIQEAVKTYEQVLEKDPAHEDAKFNLEYLKRMTQQQQQSKSENQNQKQNQNQNNQQQNSSNNNQNQDQNNKQNQTEENTQDTENENQNQRQNQNQSSPQDENENKPQENSDENNNQENSLNNNINQEQKQTPVMPAKEQEASKYDETVQAREQKFRAVKEDPGGLLRAFINEEYSKKRY